ncbi:uncharacterized protein TNCV_3711321 [Trichonephila clavipes]|uniref:Uncharacterized protein n=1 Tax=Trichonephila clavipes TaxID=2585209 RepID=A0A8X6RFX7_TRICX|nr:uncharacterized protein TNCV_3711321 [Trichonephila clavipes]
MALPENACIPPGMVGFTRGTIAAQNETDARGRDSGFTGEKSRFSVNVEVNRLSDNSEEVQAPICYTSEKFDKTWRDFYQEVRTFFNRWIEGLDVKTFDKLRDLIIADQMKKRALVEFKERHLDEWPSINCPIELAERLEEFEDVRRTLKKKTHTLAPVRRSEVRGSNQAEHFRKFDNHNTRRTGHFNPDRIYLDTPPSRHFDRRAPRKC